MYSEEIKYLSFGSDEDTHANKIRNIYFENRSYLTNILDFLDQEVIIVPSSYFSYTEGPGHTLVDFYLFADETDEDDDDDSGNSDNDVDSDSSDVDYNDNNDSDDSDDNLNYCLMNTLCSIDGDNNYHLSVLENYITIVGNNKTCIFTNKNMEEGAIIGTIIWVRNFSVILRKFGDRNLKRVSKAIVHPLIIKPMVYDAKYKCLDEKFFLFMEIYKPEVIFKYTIDTYMSNVCIDVYNKLEKCGLNGLVDKYIPSYKQCDGYGEKGKEVGYSRELCKCGGLRALCYLDI